MMTEQEFDTLWQKAEAAPHAARLLEEYPDWRRSRRRALGTTASVVALVAVVLPLLLHQPTEATNANYTAAFSNRPEVTDQYWVDLADALLTEA